MSGRLRSRLTWKSGSLPVAAAAMSKPQSLAIWVPLATYEFAVLDMFGKIANLSIGQLISDKIYNKSISVYQANGERDNTAEEVIEHLKRDVEISKAKAIKFKLGGRMTHTEYPAGRSEKLIPLVRKTFGDKMIISADANGSYDVKSVTSEARDYERLVGASRTSRRWREPGRSGRGSK